jgi:hypothetical protein
MGMDKKKWTRRVALSTIAGGLATGAVLLRALRGPKFQEVEPYGTIDVPPTKITSDLSSSDVRKAFKILDAEREMWMRFRGVAGNVQILSKTVPSEGKELEVSTTTGYVSLRFGLINSTGGDGGTRPANVEMIYSQTENSDPLWKFSMEKSKPATGNKFEGKDIEPIDHGTFYGMLTGPFAIMSGLPNRVIGSILGLWKVSRESDTPPERDAFVFHSNNKLLPVGDLLPSITLVDGHLVKLIPRRTPGQPYPILSFEDYVAQQPVSYPTKITLSHGDHGESAKTHDSTEIILSDIKVASA